MKNSIINNHKYVITGVMLASSFLVAGAALAQGPQQGQAPWGHGGGGSAMHMPGVFGAVTAIDGSTITIDSKGFGPDATHTTYSVDASSATVTKDQATSSIGNIAVGDMISVQGSVSGTSVTATAIHDGLMGRGTGERNPGVFGTVTAIDGSTITVESKGFGKDATQTTYTINASDATVTKNGASSSVSDIAVKDTVMVQGTVSGNNVTATAIRDGMPQGGDKNGATPVVQGNGQPVIGGTVKAIDGSTLTITNKSNVTYTVDAGNATIQKGRTASTVSNIAVGDDVVVQGTVNGNSVNASSVIDSGAAGSSQGGSASQNNGHRGGFGGMFGGLFGGVGGFLHSLFGFF